MDPQRFPPEFFQREDDSNDAEFYTMPRLVVHIDDGAIVAVGRLFQQLIPENAEVLDLMSSWRTHWPEAHPCQRIVGLGMNATEVADNPQLLSDQGGAGLALHQRRGPHRAGGAVYAPRRRIQRSARRPGQPRHGPARRPPVRRVRLQGDGRSVRGKVIHCPVYWRRCNDNCKAKTANRR